MHLKIIILALIGLSLTNARSFGLDSFYKKTRSSNLDKHWDAFKTTFNKVYNEELDILRRSIWEANVDLIKKHNIEYNLGYHSYYLGINEYADMTYEEFKAKFLSVKMPKDFYGKGVSHMEPLNIKDYPTSVDWRTQGLVTPIKNQGQCGSCWSFSTTGSIEGQFARKTNNLTSFSEQQLVDCSRKYGNLGCNGGLMDNAFKYVEAYGIETEADYPYKAVMGTCEYDSSKVVTKVSGYTDIKSKNETDLMVATATVGPISVAIDASGVKFQLYKGGVYNNPSCSQTNLDHGVLVVGYGVSKSTDYWIVKNSWGTSWGMDGYIEMSRNDNNQCGIATAASYPLM